MDLAGGEELHSSPAASVGAANQQQVASCTSIDRNVPRLIKKYPGKGPFQSVWSEAQQSVKARNRGRCLGGGGNSHLPVSFSFPWSTNSDGRDRGGVDSEMPLKACNDNTYKMYQKLGQNQQKARSSFGSC